MKFDTLRFIPTFTTGPRLENGGAPDSVPDIVPDVVNEERIVSKVPKKWAVLLLNDDYTTMEFVLEVLKRFFGKNEDDAVRIMLNVHQQGKGVAGVYSHEIAETKVMQVETYARAKGHPLRCELDHA